LVAVLLLAQLVAPPLQPGPVRLPNTAPQQRPKDDGAVFKVPPGSSADPKKTESNQDAEAADPSTSDWRPEVIGETPYSNEQIQQILSGCGKANINATLNACAAQLTARLIQDGYVNSRVYSLKTPTPGALEVVLGTIAELRIKSEDEALQQQIQEQLTPLIGSVLHIPTLEKELARARRRGAGTIKGGMGRLGSDPTKAVVNLTITPAEPEPLNGDVALGNNGNVGSGEWRGVATLLQKGLIERGDTALLFLELNSDGDLELGSKVASLTYTYPLGDNWSVTGSFGVSYRRFVEFQKPAYNFSFRTLQGLLQLETTLQESENLTWTAAAAFSTNRSDSFKSGRSFPLVSGGGNDGWSHSGFLKLSTNVGGFTGPLFWNTNAYFSQGIAGVTLDEHLHNLDVAGIEPGKARAVGALTDIGLSLSPTTTINVRLAGQLAFSRLPGSMSFGLGSAVGLRGLPGSLIGGDSGYLATGEVVWTPWQKDEQKISLIPYLGIGGVHTATSVATLEDSIGVTGLIGRYQNGRWEAELGWVDTFKSNDNPGLWNDWILGHGLHTMLRYSF
jgi:hemolysin activation/secretion protein|tara:strand:- start:6830 stop:8515 length:1686 start_codon:yes stop_codon:yes gene_type:complete